MKSISQKEIDRFKNIKGRARGMAIKGEGEYVLHEMGEEKFETLEAEMEKMGCPVKYRSLEIMKFYPVGYEALTTLVLKEAFNFSDQEFRKAGLFESKISFIVRMFMKYFYSLDAMADQAPKIWDKYYDFGSLRVKEMDKEKRKAVLVIRDFDHHPCHCRTLEGFIAGLVKMITKTETSCKETKCIHWGDKYHEYLLRW